MFELTKVCDAQKGDRRLLALFAFCRLKEALACLARLHLVYTLLLKKLGRMRLARAVETSVVERFCVSATYADLFGDDRMQIGVIGFVAGELPATNKSQKREIAYFLFTCD